MTISRLVMRLSLRASALALAWGIVSGCATSGKHGDRELPNFQQVDANLYRGGQPSEAGLSRLQGMGVRTIICVRGSDDHRAFAESLSFEYEHHPMSPWSPSDANVIWFLRIATDPAQTPVFLHCQHGADRTGYLIAMYRMVVDGWTSEAAIEEMTRDGNGFHDLYQGLITYVRRADVERIRAAIRP
jgi:protein tyrosine/serine phosphatase